MAHNIGCWKNADGNYRSSLKGLTEEDIQFFASLSVGDRLVVFDNSGSKTNQLAPDLSIQKAVFKSATV